MKKIINKIKNDFFNKESKLAFFTIIIASFIVHFSLYANVLSGPDTIINSLWHWAGAESNLGRFMLYFFQIVKGNAVLPMVSTIISIGLLGIIGVIIIKLFNIKSKMLIVVLGLLLAVSPNFSVTLTFFYCSDAYLFGMLFATLAVYIVAKSDKKINILVSATLIALSMGVYQSYLSVAAVLIISYLVMLLLENNSIKDVLLKLLKYFIVFIIAAIIYYSLTNLILILRHMNLSSYSGANKIGISTLLKLPSLIPESYSSFYNYFFNDKILNNAVWHTNILYLLLFIITIIAMVYIIVNKKINIKNAVLVFILLLLYPLCFGVIELIVPDVNIHLLMACSMILIFITILKQCEYLDRSKISVILKAMIIIISVIICWNYTLEDNASYVVIKTKQDQMTNVMNRIYTRIEELDGYETDMPILMVGLIDNNDYFNKNRNQLEAAGIYKMTYKFVAEWSLIWSDSALTWNNYIYEYLGTNTKIITDINHNDISKSEEFLNMESYPSSKSIKLINNTVVVKLS